MYKLIHGDCMRVLPCIRDNSIDMILTDIPYDAVNRDSNGLRNLNKDGADIMTFNLTEFLDEVCRVVRGSVCIFCGKEQFSNIYTYFASCKGSVRPVVWEKSNPSPMNGQFIYLSGVEMGVWFKKSGASVFNAFCKNSVFKYPNGKAKLHPTEKNHDLLREIILDNSNEGSVILDPCMGSGSTGLVALHEKRHFIGVEINPEYFSIAKRRIESCIS